MQILFLCSQAEGEYNIVISGTTIYDIQSVINNINLFQTKNATRLRSYLIESVLILRPPFINDYIECYEPNSLNVLTLRDKRIFKSSPRIDGIILNDFVSPLRLAQIIKKSYNSTLLLAAPLNHSTLEPKQTIMVDMNYINHLQKMGIFFPLIINNHYCIGTSSLI